MVSRLISYVHSVLIATSKHLLILLDSVVEISCI